MRCGCSGEAADAGDAEAQFQLGTCYRFGSGVKPDSEEAVYWLEKSAKQNNAYAQFALGTCYQDGEGVDEDIDTALDWFERAAALGLSDAQCAIGTYYFDEEEDKETALAMVLQGGKTG